MCFLNGSFGSSFFKASMIKSKQRAPTPGFVGSPPDPVSYVFCGHLSERAVDWGSPIKALTSDMNVKTDVKPICAILQVKQAARTVQNWEPVPSRKVASYSGKHQHPRASRSVAKMRTSAFAFRLQRLQETTRLLCKFPFEDRSYRNTFGFQNKKKQKKNFVACFFSLY